MAKTFSYKINLDAEISALQSKLKTIKTGFDNAFGGDSAKSLATSFKSIETALGHLTEKANAPAHSASIFTSMERDAAKIDASIKKLSDDLIDLKKASNDKKLSLLPESEQKRIKEAAEAVAAYTAAIEIKVKKSDKYEAAEKKETKAINEHAKALKALTDAQNLLQSTRAQKKTAGEQLKRATGTNNVKDARAQAMDILSQQKAANKLLQSARDKGLGSNDVLTTKNGSFNVSDLEANAKALNAQAEAIKPLLENYDRLSKAITTSSTAVTDANTRLKNSETALNSAKDEVRQFKEEWDKLNATQKSSALDNLKASATQLGISFDDIDFSNPERAIQQLIDKFIALREQGLQKVNEAIDIHEAELEDLADKETKVKDKIGENADGFKKESEAAGNVQNLLKRAEAFVGLQGAVQGARRAMRNAFNTIKDLDKQMTEMAVVTDLEVGDYWNQLPEYTERANKLGVSIHDAYEAATLYYQQGLKTNEVVAVSNETLKMARIAGLGAAEATDRMTAALRGFNMEVNETSAQRVADVYSELAAITASDVNEISVAMTKTASIANSAGMEFETTAAFLSQIIETTRESAETAGTALKTVIARFQELKKSPEEIGEIDGEIIDANKIETALRTVGVALRDDTGQFRNLDKVFLDLAKKWDTLDTNTQRYIATIAAGSRQQSRFIAMMSNYARTQELVTAANTSAGASNEQYEKTLDSLQSKLAQLKNAWDTFTMGIMNNGLIKFGIDAITAILNGLNAISNTGNSVFDTFLKIGYSFAIFVAGKKVIDALTTAKYRNLAATLGLKKTEEAENATKKKSTLFTLLSKLAVDKETKSKEQNTIATWKQLLANQKVKGTLLGLSAATVAFGLAIWGVTAAVKALKKASPEGQLEAAAKAAKNAAEAADRASEAYTQLTEKWSSFSNANSNIKNMVAGTAEWREEVTKLNDQYYDLIEQYPELAKLTTTTQNGYIEFTNPDDAQGIIDQYAQRKYGARAAAIGATMNEDIVAQRVQYNKLSDSAQMKNYGGASPEIGSTAAGITTGAGIGTIAGALLSLIPGVGTILGAIVTIAGLVGGATAGGVLGYNIGHNFAEENELDYKELTDTVAKKMAETNGTMTRQEIAAWMREEYGEVDWSFVDEIENAKDELASYGKTVIELDKTTQSYMKSLSSNAIESLDNKKFSAATKNQLSNVFTTSLTSAALDEVKAQVAQMYDATDLDENQTYINYWREELGADFVEVSDKYGAVKYKDENGDIKEMTAEEAQLAYASALATEDLAKRAEQAADAFAATAKALQIKGVQNAEAIVQKLYESADGLALTGEEAAALSQLSDDELTRLFNQNEALQAVYGSVEEYIKQIGDIPDNIANVFNSINEHLNHLGLNTEIADNITAKAAKGYEKQIEKMVTISGQAATEKFTNYFANILETLSAEEREQLMSQFNSIDITNINAIEDFTEALHDLRIPLVSSQLEDLKNRLIEVGQASRTVTLEGIATDISAYADLIAAFLEEGITKISAELYNKIKDVPKLAKEWQLTTSGQYVYIGTNPNATLGNYKDYLNEESLTLLQQNQRAQIISMATSQNDSVDFNNISSSTNYADKKAYLEAVERAIGNKDIFDFNEVTYHNYQGNEAEQKKYIDDKIEELKNNRFFDSTILDNIAEKYALIYEDNLAGLTSFEKQSTQTNYSNYLQKRGMEEAIITNATMAGNTSKELQRYKELHNLIAEYEDAGKGNAKEVEDWYLELNLLEQQIVKTTDALMTYNKASESYDVLYKNFEAIDKIVGDSGFALSKRFELVSAMAAQFGVELTDENYEQVYTIMTNLYNGSQEGINGLIALFEEGGEKLFDANNQISISAFQQLENSSARKQAIQALIDSGIAAVEGNVIKIGENIYQALAENNANLEDLWQNPYDWLYNANKRITAITRERNSLEREYNRLLDGSNQSSKALTENLNQQLEYYYQEAQLEAKRSQYANNTLADLLVQADASGIAELQSLVEHDANGALQVNFRNLAALKNSDQGEAIEAYIDKIDEMLDIIDDSAENIATIQDDVAGLRNTGRDEYIDLWERVRSALIKQQQESIDELNNINDSINNVSDKIIDKLQEQINADRQARDNAKTEQAIADKEARLAYLQANGGSPSEILALQQEIAEAKENYQDSLVDQTIQAMQDDNAKAAEQRERQIELAQQSLDANSVNAEEVTSILNEGLLGNEEGKKKLHDLLSTEIKNNEKPKEAIEKWETDFNESFVKAGAFKDGTVQTNTRNIGVAINNLASNLSKIFPNETSLSSSLATFLAEGGEEKSSITSIVSAWAEAWGTHAGKQDETDDEDLDDGPSVHISADKKSSIADFIIDLAKGGALSLEAINGDYMKWGDTIGKYNSNYGTLWNKISTKDRKDIATKVRTADLSSSRGDIDPDVGTVKVLSPHRQEGRQVQWEEGAVDVIEGHEVYNQTTGQYSFDSTKATLTHIQRRAFDATGSNKTYKGDDGETYAEFKTHDGHTYYIPSKYWESVYTDGEYYARLKVDPKNVNEYLQVYRYASGGLADFTGPAWLDGTKSHPEMVLNATDTANLISLKNVLAELLNTSLGKHQSSNESTSGNNYYSVDVNVDSIENDYDVEQLAAKIRDLITKDAMYRNVNAIQQIR